MKTEKVKGLASLLIAAAVTVVAAQTPRDLFERARMLEESNQNLSQAITLYTQAAAQAAEKGQRDLAATAQLRVGLLHERLGHKEDAQRALRVVVSQYADQPDVVRQAQARLATTDAAASSALAVRRLWTAPGLKLAARFRRMAGTSPMWT